jgi:hypothetical protein
MPKRKQTTNYMERSPKRLKRVCMSFLAHGWYVQSAEHAKTFTVPKNIRLFQYTRPMGVLSEPTARLLEKSVTDCSVHEELTVYMGLNTGEIAKQTVKQRVFKPGQSGVINQHIQFSHDMPGFELGLKLHSGRTTTIINPFETPAHCGPVLTTMREFMLYVSDRCKLDFGPKAIIDLHQFTCACGDFMGYKSKSVLSKSGVSYPRILKDSKIEDMDIDNLSELLKTSNYTPYRTFGKQHLGLLIEYENTDLQKVVDFMRAKFQT